MMFSVFKKIGFLGILGPPYCGIGATSRIGREILCLMYVGFFHLFDVIQLALICPETTVPSCALPSSTSFPVHVKIAGKRFCEIYL